MELEALANRIAEGIIARWEADGTLVEAELDELDGTLFRLYQHRRELVGIFEADAPAVESVVIQAEVAPSEQTVSGLRRFAAFPQAVGIPPQHKLPLLRELQLDGLDTMDRLVNAFLAGGISDAVAVRLKLREILGGG